MSAVASARLISSCNWSILLTRVPVSNFNSYFVIVGPIKAFSIVALTPNCFKTVVKRAAFLFAEVLSFEALFVDFVDNKLSGGRWYWDEDLRGFTWIVSSVTSSIFVLTGSISLISIFIFSSLNSNALVISGSKTGSFGSSSNISSGNKGISSLFDKKSKKWDFFFKTIVWGTGSDDSSFCFLTGFFFFFCFAWYCT